MFRRSYDKDFIGRYDASLEDDQPVLGSLSAKYYTGV